MPSMRPDTARREPLLRSQRFDVPPPAGGNAPSPGSRVRAVLALVLLSPFALLGGLMYLAILAAIMQAAGRLGDWESPHEYVVGRAWIAACVYAALLISVMLVGPKHWFAALLLAFMAQVGALLLNAPDEVVVLAPCVAAAAVFLAGLAARLIAIIAPAPGGHPWAQSESTRWLMRGARTGVADPHAGRGDQPTGSRCRRPSP